MSKLSNPLEEFVACVKGSSGDAVATTWKCLMRILENEPLVAPAAEEPTAPNPYMEGWLQGRAHGYRMGYSAGLFALEPQVPPAVRGLWRDASVAARDRHFREDISCLSMMEHKSPAPQLRESKQPPFTQLS